MQFQILKTSTSVKAITKQRAETDLPILTAGRIQKPPRLS